MLYNIFEANGFTNAWYLEGANASDTTQLVFPAWLAYFFTFVILFNNLVPISLYVTVEMCNAFQVRACVRASVRPSVRACVMRVWGGAGLVTE